jgi:general secretion pathway protein M
MKATDTRRLRLSAGSPAFAGLLAWWAGLQERERRLLAAGASLVGLALLWLVAVQPAWQLLRSAPVRLDTLDAQTQAMQRLALETRELRAAPQVSAAQSLAALRSASERLGARGKLVVQGDRAILTIDGIDGDTLRAWLAEVRSGARARAIEAQLSRGAQGYSGSITLMLGGTS